MKKKPRFSIDIDMVYIGENLIIGPINENTDELAFSVFNADNLGDVTKLCRLSFFSPKYISHKKMYYCDNWKMTKEEKIKLMKILQQKSDNPHIADSLKDYSIFELLLLSKIGFTAKNWQDTLNTFHEKRKNLVMPDYTQLPEE